MARKKKFTKEEEIAIQEKLTILQKMIEDIITAHDDGYIFFIAIQDSKHEYSLYTGNRCPVCAINRSIRWMIDNNLQHEEEGAPPAVVNLDDLIEMTRLTKKDIN